VRQDAAQLQGQGVDQAEDSVKHLDSQARVEASMSSHKLLAVDVLARA